MFYVINNKTRTNLMHKNAKEYSYNKIIIQVTFCDHNLPFKLYVNLFF